MADGISSTDIVNEASKSPDFLKGLITGFVGFCILLGGVGWLFLNDAPIKEIIMCTAEPNKSKQEIARSQQKIDDLNKDLDVLKAQNKSLIIENSNLKDTRRMISKIENFINNFEKKYGNIDESYNTMFQSEKKLYDSAVIEFSAIEKQIKKSKLENEFIYFIDKGHNNLNFVQNN